MTRSALLATAAILFAFPPQTQAQEAAGSVLSPQTPAATASPARVLAPTNHPRLSLDVTHLWLAPDKATKSEPQDLARALTLLDKGQDTQALSALSQAGVQSGVLGHYALYYAARAQQRLGKTTDALRTFRLMQQRELVGYLREAAAIGEAEALEVGGDHAAAADIYERLSKERPVALDAILMRLGREAEAAGDQSRAIEAYVRVFYEFPLTEMAPLARARLDGFPTFQRLGPGTQRFKLELGRAQRLFGAKWYGPAKASFEVLRPNANGDDREVVDLRIAESDYYLKRFRPARDGVARYTEKGSRQAEALYFEAVASRELGDNVTYLKNVRQIVAKYPEQTWAEEALNNLATQYVRQDDNDAADTVFRELIQRYPRGAYAERAAWKVGWRSFREGRYDETAQLFERAAVDFPRSDYRPAWLFWAGRAHEQSGTPELAEARYTLAASDYLNTYYGRLSVQRLNGRIPPPRVIADPAAPMTPPPPNEEIVRALLEIRRYDDAVNELRYVQRTLGDSAVVQATMAWIDRQRGLTATGREQFNLLRGSINQMRRAYPQFMAAGGEYLPRDVLSIIFPVSYWDLIQKHAKANGLDPYLVAALVAQESTFVPDIRSPANAVGLMQLIPSTARAYARKLGLTYSARLLTNPEANIRMGTAYLSDKIREFGDAHLALASYNAGEGAVRRWQSERPGVPTDQFIDDIPYPETQNYVKRILGTADDYRRLYGDNKMPPLMLSSNGPDDADESGFPAVVPTNSLVADDAMQRITSITPVKPARQKVTPAKAAPRAPARKAPAKKASTTKPTQKRAAPRG